MQPLPVIYAVSDLHLDTGPFAWPQAALDADIVVVAGDLSNGEFDIDFLVSVGKPVIFTPGNHDFWVKDGARDMFEMFAEMKAKAAGTQVHVLWDESVVIQGVRFLGTPLWSSFGDFNESLVDASYRHMRDYRYINAASWYANPENLAKHQAHAGQFLDSEDREAAETGRFTPVVAYDLHQKSVAWLESMLSAEFDGPTVLVTHMAPTYQSLVESGTTAPDMLLPERWELRGFDNSALARIGCYASDLAWLFSNYPGRVAMAIHGHLHHSLDFACHHTRILANPRGRHIKPLTPLSVETASLFGVSVREEDVARSQARFQAYPYGGDNYSFEPHKVLRLEEGLAPTLTPAVTKALPELEALVAEMRELLPHVAHRNPVLQRCVQESAIQRADQFESIVAQVLTKAVQALEPRQGFRERIGTEGFGFLRLAGPKRGVRPYFEAFFEEEMDPHEVLAGAISSMDECIAQLPQVPHAAALAHAEVAQKGREVLAFLTAKGYDVEARGEMLAPYWQRIHFNHGVFIVKGADNDTIVKLRFEVDDFANGGKTPRRFIFWVRSEEGCSAPHSPRDTATGPKGEW